MGGEQLDVRGPMGSSDSKSEAAASRLMRGSKDDF